MAYTHEMGMRFWREFERATMYDPAFARLVGRAGGGAIQTVLANTRANGTYPDALRAFVAPHRADWQTIADAQTDAIARHLADDWGHVQAAFEDFGQGVLLDLDPVRRANNDSVHVMDVQGAGPPVGYHRWHASIRAIQLLAIGDAAWWERLDAIAGLAWAVQSFARPKQQDVANPPIAAADLQALRDAWLPLAPDRRDRQYDLTGDVGYHPTPMRPAP